MADFQVLVVDDHADEAKTFADLIEAKSGLTCIATDDPARAVEMAECHALTVLVLDESMPRMSGTSLYARLRHILPFAAALMLTQEDDASAAGAAMRLGYRERVHKANIEDLPAIVLRLHIDVIAERARESSSVAQLYRKFWPPGRGSEVDLVSVSLLDETFVDESDWTEIVEINAGQEKKVGIQRVIERTVSFEEESTETVASQLGLKAGTLASKISATVKEHAKTTVSTVTATATSLEDTYRLPEEPTDPDQLHVRARQIQYAPQYRRLQIVLRSTCRHCKSARFFSGVVRVPTDIVAIRHVDYMSDSSTKVISTGYRRVS
jgi:CheY-like chemotaxis protein